MVGQWLNSLMPSRRFWVEQNVDAFELHAQVTKNFHDRGGEAALGRDRCSLHEENDGVIRNFPSDAFDALIVAHHLALSD